MTCTIEPINRCVFIYLFIFLYRIIYELLRVFTDLYDVINRVVQDSTVIIEMKRRWPVNNSTRVNVHANRVAVETLDDQTLRRAQPAEEVIHTTCFYLLTRSNMFYITPLIWNGFLEMGYPSPGFPFPFFCYDHLETPIMSPIKPGNKIKEFMTPSKKKKTYKKKKEWDICSTSMWLFPRKYSEYYFIKFH